MMRVLRPLAFLLASVMPCGVWSAPPVNPSVKPSGAVRNEAPPVLERGPAAPFSFDGLTARARVMATQAWVAPYRPAPDIVQRIDYAEHGQLRYRPEAAVWAHGPGAYPATLFHLGKFFATPVGLFELDGDHARELRYAPGLFSMPADHPAQGLPPDAGFAGFRLHEARTRPDWPTRDWIAYLGASYFRAIGAQGQYGLSARGLALDTAVAGPEEFPAFTQFYLAPALTPDEPAVVYALLDGPGVTGAYRMAHRRGEGVVTEVEARVFLRRDVDRLGVAPLTSMFWYGETHPRRGDDWRPEIHDSDGLAVWTGAGERLWRPLDNPARTRTSAFVDENPRGFGLLQRDRAADHYLDGVNYDLRPSVWVEPLDAWGAGAVELVEIPTDDEIHDNIVALWRPGRPARAGGQYTFRYRLHWLADEPYPPAVARVVATRTGRGGEPGGLRPGNWRKFVVEFAGPALDALGPDDRPEVVVTPSRGTVHRAFTEPVPRMARWRAVFDLEAPGAQPVDLRAYLRAGDRTLSETWMYHHQP